MSIRLERGMRQDRQTDRERDEDRHEWTKRNERVRLRGKNEKRNKRVRTDIIDFIN